MHAGWGQWEQRDVSEQEPEPFPCRDDSAILKRGPLRVESSVMPSASSALCQSFCGLLSPPSARWHLPGFWLICVQEWEGRGHWHTPVSCSLLFPACPGSSPRPSMTGGWSSRESSAAGQFSRNAAANWIHKPSHPAPPQAEWRAHWMGAEGFFSFFFFSSVSSLDPVIVSAGISNSPLRLQGSKCFQGPVKNKGA